MIRVSSTSEQETRQAAAAHDPPLLLLLIGQAWAGVRGASCLVSSCRPRGLKEKACCGARPQWTQIDYGNHEVRLGPAWPQLLTMTFRGPRTTQHKSSDLAIMYVYALAFFFFLFGFMRNKVCIKNSIDKIRHGTSNSYTENKSHHPIISCQ